MEWEIRSWGGGGEVKGENGKFAFIVVGNRLAYRVSGAMGVFNRQGFIA